MRLMWWRPPCLLRVVIVNLVSDDTAVRGVLWSSRGPWLTLRDAAVLKPQMEPTPVDGEVIVHRGNVAFVQVLP
jgi:hypothetical protein